MAKGASARAAARRQKDKWKSKRWFSIRAPRNPWSFKVIGETIAEEEEMLLGRPFEIMQNELDGDFTKMHVKIKFRIKEIVGNDAITEFIGHDVMKDFVRRQIRRERGKIDDTIDVVTDDGFFVRIKPLIVTRSSVKASQKHESRIVTRNEVVKFCAQSTWIKVQKALMDGSLEETVSTAVSKIQPVRAVFFRRSQLIQDGVVVDDGPTLEEIKAEEKVAKQQEEETLEDEDVADESQNEADSDEEAVDDSGDEDQDSVKSDDADYESMTVAQLKELLKEAGKPVSGKKADLISRLSE
ncbi:MAG: SAP domain-containing protein [Candidatus Thalassarchaeaceae archaeon]|nr:SAP domain-containing protein [Candidatus Thalassarchaeaceae archaeon]